ncbi:beta-galactosidase [Herbiconiux ginsengi]|uniref:Glycosyl hydrolases family 35 n=1 Tax=Herbiconiux ginsengi TaxID=381665 RepID=A0A1H3T698_9MICO|nr:beta-galactosidase [Herbiconiux ginsengi]SDZ45447.1 Glycosyl hydrolases family 35 [Herbiconiux ginsengi]
MTAIRVENGLVHVGDRAFPLIAGEIQFWRMDPETWGPAVRAARDAGITVVSTYLSWRRHEPTPGGLSFAGEEDPRLDVRRFLQICADEEMFVQLKPGPWICAEEPGGGYPDWLLERTELLACDDAGEVVIGYNPPFQHPVPSYAHPDYLAEVRAWFGAVWDAVRGQVYPAGPIIALQLDNEPSICFQDSLYGADYSDSALAGFRSWLRERYRDDPERLLAGWGVDPGAVGSVEPPRRPDAVASITAPARVRDWIEFKTSATGDYLAALQTMHRELGGEGLLYTVNLVTHPVHDVPVAHSAIRAATGAAIGEDHYYIPPLDAADLHRLARSAATARSAGEPLPWVPELQAGIWRSPGEDVRYPDPTPLEQEIWWGAAIALGFAGANLYMLADRENWEYAPLSSDGQRSPFFRPIARLRLLSRFHPDALTLPALPSVVVAWHRQDAYDAYAVTGTSRLPDVPWHDETAARAYTAWDETLAALTARGVSYDLWDSAGELPAPAGAPLVVPPHSGVPVHLLDAVARSGRAVIRLDDDLADLDRVIEGMPHIVTASGRVGETLVSVRDRRTGSIVHVVHWGGGCTGARLRLPGVEGRRVREIGVEGSTWSDPETMRFALVPGHRVFLVER